MSKNVAVVSASTQVVNVKVCDNDYRLEPYEVEVTGAAWIGGDYVDGLFYPPQPYPSWIRVEGEWLPPISRPNDNLPYDWNESAQAWEPVA